MINNYDEILNFSGFSGNEEDVKQNRDNTVEIEEKGEMVLKIFIDDISNTSNKNPSNSSFPLGRSGHINIKSFMEQEGLSKEEIEKIEEDSQKARNAKLEMGLKRELSAKSEKLSMAIIHKVIGDKFLIYRPLLYDTLLNGGDIVITKSTDKKPICVLNIGVFDRKETQAQKIIDEEINKAYMKNLSKKGAELNYFKLGTKEEDRKASGFLYFFVPLKRNVVLNCLNNFTSFLSEKELNLFNDFINSVDQQNIELNKQIIELKNKNQPLPDSLEESVDNFKSVIKEWKEIYEEKKLNYLEVNQKFNY